MVLDSRFGGPQPDYNGMAPNDLAAERAVLGAALLYPEAVSRLMVVDISPADFFREQHGWIWQACLDAVEKRGHPDVITACAELQEAGLLDAAGGTEYVAGLTSDVYTHIGVDAHALIVMNTARLRKVIEAGAETVRLAYTGIDAAEAIQQGLKGLGNLLSGVDSGMVRLGDVPVEELSGPDWGVPALDRLTMGAVKGRLSLLAAPSGMGKSMLASHIVQRMAARGARCAIFTMEMSNGEYQERIAHAVGGVRKRYSKYAQPLTDVERDRLDEARRTVAQWDIHSYDKSVQVERVAASVRLLAAEKPVDLVVVDYLHLMNMPDQRETSAQNLKNITKSLKQLAVDAGCHVLLLSQMNRAALGEMRSKEGQKLECLITGEKYPAPFMTGLMGGAIENDADLVVQLQRHFDNMNHIEVVVTKNRHGIEGHSTMLENFAVCRFESMTQAEVSHAARGDMTIHRALMIDQGLMEGE